MYLAKNKNLANWGLIDQLQEKKNDPLHDLLFATLRDKLLACNIPSAT